MLFFVHLLLYLEVLLLCPTSLPTILPVADQEMETIGVNLHTWLEAYTKIAVVHFVMVDVGMEKVKVAGDSEKKVVMIGR